MFLTRSAVVTSSGKCLRKSLTTSEWLFCAARWIGFWPLSFVALASLQE